MKFSVLGPLEIHARDRQLDTGPPQQCVVLAALAVDAGRLVPVEVLIDRVWGPQPPVRARRTLHTYISRIRRLLIESADPTDGSATLVRRASGYLLQLDHGQVDLHTFRQLVNQTRDPACPEPDQARLLHEALALWRGEPLAGLTGDWVGRVRQSWQQQRLDAALAWATVELRAGDPHLVVDLLTDLVDEHPVAEPLVAALMRAMCGSGRTAQALYLYARTRQRLADDLGVDPGPELRTVHQLALRGELEAAIPRRPQVGTAVPKGQVPAQLPLDVRFAGRSSELASLDRLADRIEQEPTAVMVAVLSGTAGVGKTALAVHWAHRASLRFPDGQLYANLRGFDPGGSPVSPAEAIRWFLDALQVPAAPASGQRAGRRPRSTAACWPASGCSWSWTTRGTPTRSARCCPARPGAWRWSPAGTSCPGWLPREGAEPMTVDLLSPAESRRLLAQRLGTDRVAANPAAVSEIVSSCAGLPLALAIVAARAASRSRSSLDALAAAVRTAQRGLDGFAGADPITDVRAVFSWSYRTLSDRPRTCSGYSACIPGRTSAFRPPPAWPAYRPSRRGGGWPSWSGRI